jgi:hypothetical protein
VKDQVMAAGAGPVDIAFTSLNETQLVDRIGAAAAQKNLLPHGARVRCVRAGLRNGASA